MKPTMPALWVTVLCSLALVCGASGEFEGCVATPAQSEVIVKEGAHVLLRVEARYHYDGDSSQHELWAMFDERGNFQGDEFIKFDSINCTRRHGEVCLKRYISVTGDEEVYGRQLVLRVYEKALVLEGDVPLYECINITIIAQNMTIRNELSKVEALRRNITEQENIIDDLEMMIAMNEFYRTVAFAAGASAAAAMLVCFVLCVVLICACTRRRRKESDDEEAAEPVTESDPEIRITTRSCERFLAQPPASMDRQSACPAAAAANVIPSQSNKLPRLTSTQQGGMAVSEV